MSEALKQDGVGLMLNRRVGSKVIMTADPEASDEEVLAAIKNGIVLTLVNVSRGTKPGAKFEERDGSKDLKNAGGARLGIKASKCIFIAREEILPGYKAPERMSED